MNFGKLIQRKGEFFIRDLHSEELHGVEHVGFYRIGDYFTYEVNEQDDAVDLVPAEEALVEYGIQVSTMSFYSDIEGNDDTSFGVCDISGLKGDLVTCEVLDTKGKVLQLEVGIWLVHSVLCRLAGAF